MIAKLTGKLDGRESSSVILDVQGVGYLVFCSQITLGQLPSLGERISLFIEPLIRVEQITLFGFLTEQEKSLFKLLLTVQGVGGKMCLALLSAFPPSQIEHSILSQDATVLTKADGVGPKLAQRIVRELKDKVSFSSVQTFDASGGGSKTVSLHQEAISALVNLGYKKQDVLEAVEGVLKGSEEDLSLSRIVPLALKKLTRV